MTDPSAPIPAGDWLRLALATLRRTADPRAVTGGPALILAPHPDDESLGCGGLVAALCAAGAAPVVVVLTDGAGSHPGSLLFPPTRLAALRHAEAGRAAAALGLPEARLHRLGLPDGRLAAHEAEAVGRIIALLGAERPGTVIATWRHDPHPDHAAAAAIGARVATALGPPAPRVLGYPVWGWGFAQPLPRGPCQGAAPPLLAPPPRGVVLEIGPHLAAAKGRAVAAHASQVTRLVPDVGEAFTLPAELLALAARPFELFLEEGYSIR